MHLSNLLFLLLAITCGFLASVGCTKAHFPRSVTVATPFEIDWTEADQNYDSLSDKDKVKHQDYKAKVELATGVGKHFTCNCIHCLTIPSPYAYSQRATPSNT